MQLLIQLLNLFINSYLKKKQDSASKFKKNLHIKIKKDKDYFLNIESYKEEK